MLSVAKSFFCGLHFHASNRGVRVEFCVQHSKLCIKHLNEQSSLHSWLLYSLSSTHLWLRKIKDLSSYPCLLIRRFLGKGRIIRHEKESLSPGHGIYFNRDSRPFLISHRKSCMLFIYRMISRMSSFVRCLAVIKGTPMSRCLRAWWRVKGRIRHRKSLLLESIDR